MKKCPIIGIKTGHKGGKRDDLNIYVRSSWEANYCRYLNFLKEKKLIQSWQYEPDTFWFKRIKRGSMCYTPDFKIIEKNGDIVYHEIKGYMDKKSMTKLKRMRKYYPDIKLNLIQKKEYKEIKQWAKLIPNWEE